MGHTSNPQETENCPNCNQSGNYAEIPDDEGIALTDCHNDNCAVDRYWGKYD